MRARTAFIGAGKILTLQLLKTTTAWCTRSPEGYRSSSLRIGAFCTAQVTVCVTSIACEDIVGAATLSFQSTFARYVRGSGKCKLRVRTSEELVLLNIASLAWLV